MIPTFVRRMCSGKLRFFKEYKSNAPADCFEKLKEPKPTAKRSGYRFDQLDDVTANEG